MPSHVENYIDSLFEDDWNPEFAVDGNPLPPPDSFPAGTSTPVEQAPGASFSSSFDSSEFFTAEELGIGGAFGLSVDALPPSDLLFDSSWAEPTTSNTFTTLEEPSLLLSDASGEALLPGPSSSSSTGLPSTNHHSSPSSPTTTAEPSGEAPTPPKAPAFPPFKRHFATGDDARNHRRAAKRSINRDPNIAAVKANRDDWVRRLYEAMININGLIDKESSTHRKRFETGAFDQMDLEAAAHNVFDKAIAVHERGWTRPLVYHKEAVRGKFKDPAKNCCRTRLEILCEVLTKSKAACNDALQGGLELAQLAYNPSLRIGGKIGNAIANQQRRERLQVGTEVLNERAVAAGKEVKTRKKAQKPVEKEKEKKEKTKEGKKAQAE
ncbi:uncharacterized protein EI97DRAFT_435841 [Westerdykella ornata]|uniref:Uncharacterized protein n=1 Tax=Westerdykella ornata TaxID=318751 RepID=A0A6A6JB78_WESOR|nr:uncharacterized protein EI97DRAFT_435841 [Westerdykella ornata]KAF2273672.1 hypothetical protein EI97DRAFT_435841 [Westerdykella ornata]